MRRIALTLVPLLFLACDRAPVAPDAGPDLGPTFNIENAPLESGIVMRDGYPVGALMRDPDTQLGLAIGRTAKEACSGTPRYYLQTWADKVLADRLVSMAQGTDVPTEVWDASQGWDCATILAGEPLASGVSDVVVTNNDLFNSGQMNRVVMWRAHGILARANGENAVARWQWRYNENQGGVTNLSITLH